jgi:hypothetical protein
MPDLQSVLVCLVRDPDRRFDNSATRHIGNVFELHQHIAEVIEEQRSDRRDDLISHI